MNQDKIILKGMIFHAYHGIHEWEKSAGQKFVVDIEIFKNLSVPGKTDSIGDTINYSDIFIEVKSWTGKKFSIFWSENEIEMSRELGKRYWIYFVSEIDIENKTSPNIPEMIQDPFNRIDPLNINPENTEFDKKWESIHITKKTEEN